MKKKFFAMVMAGVMAVSVLAGCGSNNADTSNSNGSASGAGSGSAGPSRPDSPWTEGAFITSFSSGCGQPLPTGASSPMSVQTRRAL